MTGKFPFVLGKLPTELNHIPLLENNVVNSPLCKNNGELTQWKGQPYGVYYL